MRIAFIAALFPSYQDFRTVGLTGLPGMGHAARPVQRGLYPSRQINLNHLVYQKMGVSGGAAKKRQACSRSADRIPQRGRPHGQTPGLPEEGPLKANTISKGLITSWRASVRRR